MLTRRCVYVGVRVRFSSVVLFMSVLVWSSCSVSNELVLRSEQQNDQVNGASDPEGRSVVSQFHLQPFGLFSEEIAQTAAVSDTLIIACLPEPLISEKKTPYRLVKTPVSTQTEPVEQDVTVFIREEQTNIPETVPALPDFTYVAFMLSVLPYVSVIGVLIDMLALARINRDPVRKKKVGTLAGIGIYIGLVLTAVVIVALISVSSMSGW